MTPTFFALIVIAGGLLTSGTGAIYFQVILCLFGAAAAVALPALGGASITPAVMFLPFLTLRALTDRPGGRSLRVVPRAGFWILLLALWGVFTALSMPRLFAGEVSVLTVDRYAGSAMGAVLMPLRPVSGNITQAGYALGGAGAFLALRALLNRAGRLEVFRDAVLWLVALNWFAALLNIAEFYLHLPAVLEYVRNGGYVVFGAYEEAGLVRIQGTFTETSAFSSFTLPLFAFSQCLWARGVRLPYSGVLSLASLLLLSLSTSGTAYAGLAVYLLGLGAGVAFRGYQRGRVPHLWFLVCGTLALGLMVSCLLILRPGILDRVGAFFQATLLGKLSSRSGVQRSSWNQQAWSNFVDTYGFGVGLGSARASSFVLVLLSNLGLVGTLLFAAFVASCWNGVGSDADSELAAVSVASRQAMLAALIAASISGAVFDLGIGFYAFAAAASINPTKVSSERDQRETLSPQPSIAA